MHVKFYYENMKEKDYIRDLSVERRDKMDVQEIIGFEGISPSDKLL